MHIYEVNWGQKYEKRLDLSTQFLEHHYQPLKQKCFFNNSLYPSLDTVCFG